MHINRLIRKVLPTYGYTVPDSEFLWKVEHDVRFTKDMQNLSQWRYQLVFATDSYKKDHVNHDVLGSEKRFMFPAYTQKHYRFWASKDPTEYPIAMRSDEMIPKIVGWPTPAKIKGEVYLIPTERLCVLDNDRENGVQYVRHKVRLIVPHRAVVFLKDHTLDPEFGPVVGNAGALYTGSSIKHTAERVCLIRAWMYCGVPQFWDPLLSAYDYGAVETFQSNRRRWLPEYYHIRRPDLQNK